VEHLLGEEMALAEDLQELLLGALALLQQVGLLLLDFGDVLK
jgi:hypothetical protein